MNAGVNGGFRSSSVSASHRASDILGALFSFVTDSVTLPPARVPERNVARMAATGTRMDPMELFIIGLVLYFGGKWLVRVTGADQPMFICRDCARVTRGYNCCSYCDACDSGFVAMRVTAGSMRFSDVRSG